MTRRSIALPIIDLTVVAASETTRESILYCDGHSPDLRVLLTVPERSRDPLVQERPVHVSFIVLTFIAHDGISELKRLSELSELFEAYGVPSFGETERSQSVGPQGRMRRLVELIPWTCWWVLGKNYADR